MAPDMSTAMARGSPHTLREWEQHFTTMADAAAHQQADIWKQMSYTPPRGPCAYKASLMTPSCACLRFMIHPVKAASSFACDGCAHHASFHRMGQAEEEEELVRRWSAVERQQRATTMTTSPSAGTMMRMAGERDRLEVAARTKKVAATGTRTGRKRSRISVEDDSDALVVDLSSR